MWELYPERHLGNNENALTHICKQVQNFLFLLNANGQTNKNKLNKHWKITFYTFIVVLFILIESYYT